MKEATSSLRPYHMVGRIADAEFVALLPETSSTEVIIIANQIERTAKQITLNDRPLQVRAGYATLSQCTADELLIRADESLNEARKAAQGLSHNAS